MAYDYKQRKSMYTAMSDVQRQRAHERLKNNADWQRFNQEYSMETGNANPPSLQSSRQNTYGDLGGANQVQSYQGEGVGGTGNYTYNPNLKTNSINSADLAFGARATNAERNSPGYIEGRNNSIANALYNEGKIDETSIRNYLNTFGDFRAYDQIGQDNTVASISKRMGAMKSQYETQNTNRNLSLNTNYQSANILGESNYPMNFWDATNQKLKDAYGIEDLDALRERYPDEYEELMKNLGNLEGVWNATDPNSRKFLEGHLQGVLGVATGVGADKSKLRGVESALLDKFENPDQIKQDVENVTKLSTEGFNTSEIASRMGVSEDQVHQLTLLANGQDSRAGEYYKLKKLEADKITEPFDEKIKRLDEDKKIALERANRNAEWHKQDFDTTMQRQRKQNDINAHNADMLAGKYGFAFSKRGIEGLNYIGEQAQNIMDDLVKNYDRGQTEIADGISDIMRNWQRNNKELMKASQDALNQAKNNFTSGVLQVQQKYGTVGLQAQQAFAEAVQGFIKKAEDIYDNALKRQQDNLTNLITNASNLNALNVQNFNMRNAKIQQFQQESLGMNKNQVLELAQELGLEGSYQKLASYQLQATQNTLNGYASGASMVFGEAVKLMIDQGYTPEQAISTVVNSNEFAQYKARVENKGDNWSMSDGLLYNKTTGEVKNVRSEGKQYAPIQIGEKTRGVYDPNTGQTIYFDNGKSTSSNDGGSTAKDLNSFINAHPVGSTGGECGHFVRKYLGWRSFPDSIADKEAKINSYDAKIGSVAVINWGNNAKATEYQRKYGHVGIVTSVNGDGTVTIFDSNGTNGKHKVGYTRVNAKYITGYIDPSGGNDPLSNNGIPISYEQKIYNLVPTSLKNSDTELKNLYSKSKQLYEAGKSAEEAALTFLGFKVSDKNKDFATNLVDHARIGEVSDSFYGVLSDYVNKGKNKEAVRYMENTLILNAKNKANVRESKAISMISKINELERKIKGAESKFGPISGPLNSAWTTWLGSDKTQGIKSDIVNIFAGIRNEISGASVTDSEKQYLEPMMPSIDDKYVNVQAKLNSMKQSILQDLNGVRQEMNLPALNEDTLLDVDKRVALYMPVVKITPTTTTQNKSTSKNAGGIIGGMVNNTIGAVLQNMGRR